MEFAVTKFVDPEPGALVERFSWEIDDIPPSEPKTEEYEQLRADFIEERDRKERNRQEILRIEGHFAATRSDDEITFQNAFQDLRSAKDNFQKSFPGQTGALPTPTSWEDVNLTIQEVQDQWDKNKKDTVGRAKNWLRRMGNGMKNHSAVLSLIPSESMYTSLVAGAVTMIIKASANHIGITESFAQGVVTINDAVNMISRCQVHRTAVIQQLTMRLYTEIFKYLTKFITWHTERSWKRLRWSFNENLVQQFQDSLNSVKELASRLCQEIQLHVSADARVSKLLLENTTGDVRYLIELQETGARQSTIQQELVDKILRSQLAGMQQLANLAAELRKLVTQRGEGEGITNFLIQEAERSRSRTPEGRNGSENCDESLVVGSGSRGIQQWPETPADIEAESRHFEDYFDRDHIFPFADEPLRTLADSLFVARLNGFTETVESQVMYAHNNFRGVGPNHLQQAVATWTFLARKSGIAVVSYFCDLSSDDPPPRRTRESVELTALLYALLRQVINLLPAGRPATAPLLLRERLSSLDGTLNTWELAVELFGDLVNALELPLLLLVIDGLDVVDNDAYPVINEKIQQLVRCITRVVSTGKKEDRLIKVLFTTVGLSGPLCEELDGRDIVVCRPSTFDGNEGRRRSRRIITYN